MKFVAVLLSLIFFHPFAKAQIQFDRDTLQVLQNSDAGNVAAADVDQDGDIDLIISGTSPVSATLYLNDGSGTFTVSSQTSIVDVYAGASEFADVDNDGDQDLLITGNTSATISTANLYLNDGAGTFSLSAIASLEPSRAGDIDFGDIDGDGDVDLIMTGKNGADAVITKLYKNDGAGAFSEINSTGLIPVWTSAVELFDIDGDDDLDLFICGEDSSGHPVSILYRNDGSGNFSEIPNTPFTGVALGDIAFGDTDNDGDQDVLITGQDSNRRNTAEFYQNDGGNFNLVQNTTFKEVALHTSSFADFDNDGKLDLLHIGNSSNGLVGNIYQNMGGNRFALVDSSIAGSYNGTNIAEDLNGDGKLDIVVTGTSFTLPVRAPKIYLNRSIQNSLGRKIDNSSVSVWPNPSKSAVHIDLGNRLSEVQLALYDINGRSLFVKQYINQQYIDFVREDLQGVYFLELRSEGSTRTKRLIFH